MDNTKVKKAIEEMVASHYRAQAERDLQKEICERMAEEQEVDKAEFRKMAKFAYEQNVSEKRAEIEAIESKLAELGIA